jgi:DNA-binding MarR family transcriptional regulator
MKAQYLPSGICTALMRIGTRMAAGFDKHFAPLAITQAQFRTLLAIRERGGRKGITPSALADHLLIERATVSVLTSRMVEQGWLARKPGENRRTFRLVLTKAGTQVLQGLIPRAVALANQTLADIPRGQLRQMQANLEFVEARLRSPAPEGSE